MAAAAGIVPPSLEICEDISAVCIFAVFGGGPTFGIMNSSRAVFFFFFLSAKESATAVSLRTIKSLPWTG